jgi:CRISPR-associated protein Csb2
VAYTRHPEASIDDVFEALRPLGEPPVYWLPETRRGHTRHYMPKSTQKSGLNETQLTLDSYVSLDPEQELVIAWPDADLSDRHRRLVSDLVESLPYLGRAESVVEAHLAGDMPVSTDGYASIWRPNPDGMERLMCPSPEATRGQLEIAPWQMRKGRRLLPDGCRWVTYEEVRQQRVLKPHETPHASHTRIEVMRWTFVSQVPFRAVNGILATERLRMLGVCATKPAKERDDRYEGDEEIGEPVDSCDAGLLAGHSSGEAAQHRHAHWLWTEKDGFVDDLILWVPAGLSHDAATRVASVTSALGLRQQNKEGGFAPRGFVEGDLNLVGWGGQELLADVITPPHGSRRGGTVWSSETPHLLVRRGKKNQSIESLAAEDVKSELKFRFGDQAPAVLAVRVMNEKRPSARDYRRQRWGESLSSTLTRGSLHERIPVWLEVQFAEHVDGPLVLGGLSHFGFGRLRPRE